MNSSDISTLIDAGQFSTAQGAALVAAELSLVDGAAPDAMRFTAQYVRASRMVGQYALGLDFGVRMIEHCEGKISPEAGTVLIEIANIYRLQRDYGRSEEVLQSAIPLLDPPSFAKNRSQAFWGLGVIKRLRGDFPAALSHFDAAKNDCEAIGYPIGLAHCHREIGVTHRQSGKLNEAEAEIGKALNIYGASNNLMGVAHCHREIGTIERLRNEFGSSKERLLYAYALFQSIDAKLGQANTLTEIAILYRMIGNSDSAEGHHRQALALYKALGDPEGSRLLEKMWNNPETAGLISSAHDLEKSLRDKLTVKNPEVS